MRIPRIAAMIALSFGLYAAAQTTYNVAVPQPCGVYSAAYSCPLTAVTPSGNDLLRYAPHSGYPFGYVYFAPGTGDLGDLGWATIDNVITTHIGHTDNGKRPNQPYYIGQDAYTETTTFHEQAGNPVTFTGSTSLNYTTTTQCCSSGRGASAHTVWTVTAGTVSVTQ